MHGNVDPNYMRWICADAYDLVRGGSLDARFLYTISAAAAGNEKMLDCVEGLLSKCSLGRADEQEGTDLFFLDLFADEKSQLAIRRERSKEELERQAVVSVLSDRLAGKLTQERQRPARAGIVIPPAPLSQEFIPYLAAIDDRFAEEVMQLGALMLWHEALLPTFYKIMGKGIDGYSSGNLIDLRKEDIARRRHWFEDMRALRTCPESIAHFFMDRMHAGHSDESIRAMAWLNSFQPTIEFNGTIAALSGALLIYEIHQLHKIAPLLTGVEFTYLLTPYCRTMTYEEIEENVRTTTAPEEPFIIYRAGTILAWHQDPSKKLVERLVATVKGNDGLETLEEFCQTMLATNVDSLDRKIGQLWRAGLDVSPLLYALGTRFPDRGMGGGGSAAADEGQEPPSGGDDFTGCLPDGMPSAQGIPAQPLFSTISL